MKTKRPWWHELLMPYFHWRADVREKREAMAALKKPKLIGYFSFNTNWIGEGATPGADPEQHLISAWESGDGKRELRFLTPEGYGMKSHPWYAYAKAWLDGDDNMRMYLTEKPRKITKSK